MKCHDLEKPAIAPAFHDIAERYRNNTSGFDLHFMSVERAGDLPERKRSTVVVAQVRDELHIRIFDADGRIAADKTESVLGNPETFSKLKECFRGNPAAGKAKLPVEEHRRIIENVAAISGFTKADSVEFLIDKVKHGGKGNWTKTSRGRLMPAFEHQLTDATIRRLIEGILRQANASQLQVMKMGLGSGTVTSDPPGINCGTDCEETYSAPVPVRLTATARPGAVFSHWEGDASGTANPTTVMMDADRSVRAVFKLERPIPKITDFSPEGIRTYLAANDHVNSPGRFLSALRDDFKQNWILMTRSESLQTGTAKSPRILLSSATARYVFTIGLTTHDSFPGSHPNAVEFMQWDEEDEDDPRKDKNNFRFHEIVLNDIPAMGPGTPPTFDARRRGISIDDQKCFQCHSTRNVYNNSTNSSRGTTGPPGPIGSIPFKSKPNWDTYDSWGGQLAFNRDRIYQGSVEAAAFRSIFNLWTWRDQPAIREIIEQLRLQPPKVPAKDEITRESGGTFDGHIRFAFDDPDDSPVQIEPEPQGKEHPGIGYEFDRQLAGSSTTKPVQTGRYVTLQPPRHANSNDPLGSDPDEGRGVFLFDLLGGGKGELKPNQKRIAHEMIHHRFATGDVLIDIRPVALAISRGLLEIRGSQVVAKAGLPALADHQNFFDRRNGMQINELVNDLAQIFRAGQPGTRAYRAYSFPRRKADIQRLNLDRKDDVYLLRGDQTKGLIQEYGDRTYFRTDTSLKRLRQEVFRREADEQAIPDRTVMGGIFPDREIDDHMETVALFRYFLEPLGVSVDKWSMGVRGRSRTYGFADVFSTYTSQFKTDLRKSLQTRSVPGLTDPDDNAQLIRAVNRTLASLPAVDAPVPFTDIQRIFNKSCIECHGGLNYPPYVRSAFIRSLDLSEDASQGSVRLQRSLNRALQRISAGNPDGSSLYRRLIDPAPDNPRHEACPRGIMPCGGPALSRTDINTIRRWIEGRRSKTFGLAHIRTIHSTIYDFPAAGEFVHLRGTGTEIQVRQTPVPTPAPVGPDLHTGLTSNVSVNTAIAMRFAGQRITYQPNLNGKPDPTGLQLRVNGEVVQSTADGIPLASGGRIIPTSAPGGIQIEAPGGSVIVVTPGWWEHQQLWHLDIDMRHMRATRGLMGAIAPGNWLPALPDGTLLGLRPKELKQRYDVLYNRFGDAWRVTDETSLFDYADGTSTKTFTVKEWPGVDSSNPLELPQIPGAAQIKAPQKRIARKEAAELCQEILDEERRADVIQDLANTGEQGFLKTSLLVQKILSNKLPTPPVLISPAEFQNVPDGSIRFRWSPSTDADGDTITYRHYVWPADESPNNNDAVAVFEATGRTLTKAAPELQSGKTYFWKVIAEDGKGGTVESETWRFDIE